MLGQGHSVAASHTSGYDGDLVHPILMRTIVGADCMTSLVISCEPDFLFGLDTGLLLGTCHHLDGCLFDVLVGDRLSVGSCSQQCGFIGQVRKVGTGEAGCALCDIGEVHIGSKGLVLGVHLEDLFSALDVRIADHDLTVESAGTEQCRVEDVTAVGCRNDDDAFIAHKTVHFYKELVQGLLTFIMTAAQTCTSVSAHCVDLVNEDDGRSVFLCSFKEVTDTGRTHTDEHFHEIGTGDREERTARLTCYRLCKQCLTGTGRTEQQHAPRDLCTHFGVFAGILEEVHKLRHFKLFFLGTGNIGESHLLCHALILDIRLAEVIELAAACLPHHEDEQHNAHDEDHKGGQVGDQP